MTVHRVRRRSGPDEEIFRLSQRYLMLRAAKLAAEKNFSEAARPLKAWLNDPENGEEDANGNRIYRFGRSVPDGKAVDGKEYAGVMLRRTQGLPTFDEDEVLEFARNAGDEEIPRRLLKTIVVPDLEQLYVLQQEGLITEDELRALMHVPKPTYALWPVEAADLTEEE